jgi:glycosyltransferase involved in cell wall biosynthesis
MARALMQALSGPVDVELVSDLRIRDGKGDATHQQELERAAAIEAERLIALNRWSIWVSYHNYYKAPDLIGPAVCRALNIPYVLIEATRASKRLNGPWDRFARAAEAACDQADVIFHLTERDGEALRACKPKGQLIDRLHPFLARETLGAPARPKGRVILSAGMMRGGDKMASYRGIAAVLAHLTAADWVLRIAGDGPAGAEVEALFASFGDRVVFLGQLDAAGMAQAYHEASVFLWPGVNEAFGMVYLEAQAAGVPVVAERRPGVEDVVDCAGMAPMGDPAAMAQRIDQLLKDTEFQSHEATQARQFVEDRHLIGTARTKLWQVMAPLMAHQS